MKSQSRPLGLDRILCTIPQPQIHTQKREFMYASQPEESILVKFGSMLTMNRIAMAEAAKRPAANINSMLSASSNGSCCHSPRRMLHIKPEVEFRANTTAMADDEVKWSDFNCWFYWYSEATQISKHSS